MSNEEAALIDVGDYDVEDLDSGSFLRPEDAGKYHFLVQDVKQGSNEPELVEGEDGKDSWEKFDMIEVSLSVLAPVAKLGRTMNAKFRRTGKMGKQSLKFAIATGLVTKEQLIAAQKKLAETGAAPKIPIQFGDSRGQSFCCEVRARKYTDKDGNKQITADLGWEYYSPIEGKKNGFDVDPEYCDENPFDGGADAGGSTDEEDL